MKKMSWIWIVFSGVLAIFSASLMLLGVLGQASFVIAHRWITWGLVFLLSAFLFYFMFQKKFQRRDFFILVAALLFSICQVTGFVFIRREMEYFSWMSIWFTILSLTALAFAAFKNIYCRMGDARLYTNWFERKTGGWVQKIGGKVYWIFFAVILICWIPMYLSCYPGLYSYDGPGGVYSILVKHEWINNIPIVWNLYQTGCLVFGKVLFGSYSSGIAIYSAVTGLVIISIMAYVCYRMLQYGVPKSIVLLSLLFFAWNPVIVIHVFTTTKEALFGAFLLFLAFLSLDLLVHTEAFFKSKFQVCRYGVVAVLMCLMRLQGIYMLIVFTPFAVVACKKYRVKTSIIMVASIGFVWLFNGPILTALNVQPADMKEAMSVPIQQVARVMNLHPDIVTDEEKKSIYEVIPKEHITDYTEVTADPIKSYFNYTQYKRNPGKYAKLYLKLGLRDPKTYLESFLYGSVAYVYLGNTSFIDSLRVWTIFPISFPEDADCMKWFPRETKQFLPKYTEYREKVQTGSYLQSLPVVSILVSNGLPFISMVFTAGFLLWKKRGIWALPLLLFLGYWGTLLLGPMILIRYTLCIMIAVPFILSLCFMKGKDEKEFVM